MAEPYYFRIKDPCEFLRYYLSIYEEDYNKARAKKIVSVFPELRNSRVLDIGCGGGFYSLAAYKKNCRNITLADIFLVCVKAAKLNLQERADLNPEGVLATATNLPFKGGCFDFCLCIDLAEHIKEDHVLLQELGRVLKDGGIVLLATQNSRSLNYILEAPIQRYVLKNLNWMGWDPTHVRFYTPKSLSHLMMNCGFIPFKIVGTYFIP